MKLKVLIVLKRTQTESTEQNISPPSENKKHFRKSTTKNIVWIFFVMIRYFSFFEQIYVFWWYSLKYCVLRNAIGEIDRRDSKRIDDNHGFLKAKSKNTLRNKKIEIQMTLLILLRLFLFVIDLIFSLEINSIW